MKIFRNSKLIGELLGGTFRKDNIDEHKHLLWLFHGAPSIDAETWDRCKDGVEDIVVTTTKGRRFSCLKKQFEQHKKTIDYGYGKQYCMDRKYWNEEAKAKDSWERFILFAVTETKKSRERERKNPQMRLLL